MELKDITKRIESILMTFESLRRSAEMRHRSDEAENAFNATVDTILELIKESKLNNERTNN